MRIARPRFFAADESGYFQPHLDEHSSIDRRRMMLQVGVSNLYSDVERYPGREILRRCYLDKRLSTGRIRGRWTELNGQHSTIEGLEYTPLTSTQIWMIAFVHLLKEAGFRGLPGQRAYVDKFWRDYQDSLFEECLAHFELPTDQVTVTRMHHADDEIPLVCRTDLEVHDLYTSRQARERNRDLWVDLPTDVVMGAIGVMSGEAAFKRSLPSSWYESPRN